MKINSLLTWGISVFAALAQPLHAQDVKITNGPALENDVDIQMNRLIDGDAASFYAYRVRSKGRGTSFYVEKYNKETMNKDFSREIDMGEGRVKLEDVLYAKGNVYVFTRMYDKVGDKMTCYYQTVSSDGVVANEKNPLVTVTSDHYEFVDFDISMNPSETKLLVKTSHKPNKEGSYTTDFTLVDLDGMKTMWTKTVDRRLFSGREISAMSTVFQGPTQSSFRKDNDCLGIRLDDEDNIFYAY